MKTAALCTLLVLTGCATPEFKDGWRTGRVETVLNEKTEIPQVRLDCRAIPSAEYSVVSYSFGHTPNLRTNVIVPTTDAKRGDVVKVNINACQPSQKVR